MSSERLATIERYNWAGLNVSTSGRANQRVAVTKVIFAVETARLYHVFQNSLENASERPVSYTMKFYTSFLYQVLV